MPDPLGSRSKMWSSREMVYKALKGRHVNNLGRQLRDKRNKSDVLAGFLTRRASKILLAIMLGPTLGQAGMTKPRDNITR